MACSPIHILIIEDEETDYLLTRRMLSAIQNQSYEVQWAKSWATGIEAIRRREHDVCLLDFRIDGGNGLEILKESRNIGCIAPVILLTGVGDHQLDVEAMALGAADFLVKGKITPELLERSIRYSIVQAQTMDELIRTSVAQPRFGTALLNAFGTLGVILALVGIYGVVSYAVSLRTREIGVRVALGAKPGDVLNLVIGHGLRLAGFGITIGLVATLVLTKFMASLLFGIRAYDPLTFIVAPVLLAGVAIMACYIPARRAMRVDPMVALRYE